MTPPLNHRTRSQATTHRRVAVGAVGLDAMAEGVVESLLPPIGTGSDSTALAQLYRDIRRGQSQPMHLAIRVMLGRIESGESLPTATQWLRDLEAIAERQCALRERRMKAGALPFSQRICTASVRETRAQSEADIAITKVQADPGSASTIRAAIQAVNADAEQKEVVAEVLTEQLIAVEMGAGQ